MSGAWAKAHARATDPETSHEAAEASEGLAHRHHGMILGILSGSPGMAPEEIADASGGRLDKVEVCRRVSELARAEKIVAAGVHINRSGRRAVRWRRVS